MQIFVYFISINIHWKKWERVINYSTSCYEYQFSSECFRGETSQHCSQVAKSGILGLPTRHNKKKYCLKQIYLPFKQIYLPFFHIVMFIKYCRYPKDWKQQKFHHNSSCKSLKCFQWILTEFLNCSPSFPLLLPAFSYLSARFTVWVSQSYHCSLFFLALFKLNGNKVISLLQLKRDERMNCNHPQWSSCFLPCSLQQASWAILICIIKIYKW